MSPAHKAAARLVDLLRREHHALADFLVALADFDRRREWVDLGHRSLFYFLTRDLGLPNGPAYYRKTAADLIQRYPEIVEPLRDGRLHLTSLVELSKVLTPENRAKVVPRFFHTSKREAQEVRAALQPDSAPALRTVVTSVAPRPVSALAVAGALTVDGPVGRPEPTTSRSGAGGDALGLGAPLALLPEEVTRANTTLHDVAPAAPAETARPQRAEVQPLTVDLRRLHLTVSRRLLEKLAAARDVLSHSHPGASEDEILELGLDLIIARHAKRRGIGAKPRESSRASAARAVPGAAQAEEFREREAAAAPQAAPPFAHAPVPARSRHVPAHVWREVWERDAGRCTWPLEKGGVCGSTHRIQLDHVDGWARGAPTTAAACRLLCAFHNDIHARELYGDAAMDRYTRPKRGPRCSEPAAAYG
jgi:hypothetical protein